MTTKAKADEAKLNVPDVALPRFFIIQHMAVAGTHDGKPCDFYQGALVAEDELAPHVDFYLAVGAIKAYEG